MMDKSAGNPITPAHWKKCSVCTCTIKNVFGPDQRRTSYSLSLVALLEMYTVKLAQSKMFVDRTSHTLAIIYHLWKCT
jgi:hypothetical protein